MAASSTAGVHGARFERILATEPSREQTLARLDALARLLDSAFVVPGTQVRVGLDSIIGPVPGIGDLVTTAMAGYIVWEARRLGLPRWKVARMVVNVAIDAAIGAVPLAGDLADVFFKANRRNIAILRGHLEAEGLRPAAAGRSPEGPIIEGEIVSARTR